MLLYSARKAITGDHRPTALSRALSFVYGEYQSSFYWWEVLEMLRRFFLVGLMSILPPGFEGSVVQLVIAGLFCILYLVLQLHAQPFRCERRLRRAGIVRVPHGLLLVCRHQGWRPCRDA